MSCRQIFMHLFVRLSDHPYLTGEMNGSNLLFMTAKPNLISPDVTLDLTLGSKVKVRPNQNTLYILK